LETHVHAVRFTPAAAADLERLPVYVRRRVVNEIRRQLVTDPLTFSRRKKVIVGVSQLVRQLRVGDYRVFYDVVVDEPVVLVWGIRRKGRRTTGEIL
jgi:mRNA-degrading endonuclease RelE of RelBE toxin-antitoxin system